LTHCDLKLNKKNFEQSTLTQLWAKNEIF
jgi:hypothetical protein